MAAFPAGLEALSTSNEGDPSQALQKLKLAVDEVQIALGITGSGDSTSVRGILGSASAADLAKLHAITAAAATLNQIASAFGTQTFDRAAKTAKVALAAVDTGGGIFSWQNPETGTITVTGVDILVGTVASGACSIDVGVTAASGTTQADNLIDGLDVHTAAGVFSTLSQAGANGIPPQQVASGKWVTGSKDSGASAGLVGFAYIRYYVQ